ncbi:MAG: hypothetical protein QOJ61_2674, partial [Mycobacterium sp.]|nr:hypothetical protein [Mycobacterium sp.]
IEQMKRIGFYALTEPGGDSDLQNMSATALPDRAALPPHHDDGFPWPPSGLLPAFEHLAPLREGKGCTDFDVQLTAIDQSGQFRELVSIGCHHKKLAAAPYCSAISAGGGADKVTNRPPRRSTRNDRSRVCPPTVSMTTSYDAAMSSNAPVRTSIIFRAPRFWPTRRRRCEWWS